ncbi:MAG: ATP-binding protein, partial [Candidatus Binatia bacterium]
HRDLKPDNVLVVGSQVKVLDFGLSIYVDAVGRHGQAVSGTMEYMAPEVLRGEPPSHQVDLYSLGMIAYELFSGRHPFEGVAAAELPHHILNTRLPYSRDDCDGRVVPVLARLLDKRPERRPAHANEVIATLADVLDMPLAIETIATRESFLQAAPLVGRSEELQRLTTVLREAADGSGATWLVAGESGIGKSRLLDELRSQALVDGVTVLQGHCRSQGAAPFHVWRNILRGLVLRIDVTDQQAAVLRAIVDDVHVLLGRHVPEAPEVSPEAAQTRLAIVVEELFRASDRLVLVLLEDLQWAGSESLQLLTWMTRVAASVPLVFVATYRVDETSDLSSAVAGAQILALQRLTRTEIAELSAAIAGSTGRRPELVALLERETEGIPFFIVEAMRALSESASGFDALAGVELPARVASGGMQRVIRRRLSRVSSADMAALRTAAVIARDVDASLLVALHPALRFYDWAARCSAAAVLELRGERWRFAHDKLREQLLHDLSPELLRQLHRRVADAMERQPKGSGAVVALAHHWREAGDAAREAGYAYRAGLLALQSGACREAVVHLERTVELLHAEACRAPAPPRGDRAGRRRIDPNAG